MVGKSHFLVGALFTTSRKPTGICGYLAQYAKYADLDMFLRLFAPDQDRHRNNFTYTLINVGLATQNDTLDIDVEANCKEMFDIF